MNCDKEKITKVCIDDFAIKKRHTYGTILIDIETHTVIDLLEFRETKDVAEWLKTYPNLEIVSRDGSISYKRAIQDANVNIIQVSDRFHLLKGLTDAAKSYISQSLKANIGISTTSYHDENELEHDENELEMYWEKEVKEDQRARKHVKTLEKKMHLVEQVRELGKRGCSKTHIAKTMGISRTTVMKYLSPDFNPVHGKYHTAQGSKIKPYADEIKKMLTEGIKFKEIEVRIRKMGYEGASSTIRMFATRERKMLKEIKENGNYKMDKIERKQLIKLLYKPIDDVKGLTQKQLDKVIEAYPTLGEVYSIVKSFKEVLFSKKSEKLEEWIEKAKLLDIEELNSFIGGITRDQEAVEKAIEFALSNGLAEGFVNKLKVIKRVMYGRCSFSLLKAKLLQLEKCKFN